MNPFINTSGFFTPRQWGLLGETLTSACSTAEQSPGRAQADATESNVGALFHTPYR